MLQSNCLYAFLFTLSALFPGTVWCGIEDEVPKEAIEAWRAAATEPAELTVKVTHTIRWKDGRSNTETEEYVRSQHGLLVIYDCKEPAIFLRNNQGSYVLEKRGDSAHWSLAEAVELGEGSIQELTYLSFLLSPAIQLYPAYTLDDAAKQESIEWSNWREYEESGERLASFELVVPERIKNESVIISPTRWEISVSPEHYYGIRTARKFAHETGELLVEITNEYSDMLPVSFPSKRVANCLYNDTVREVLIESVSSTPVPQERFQLSTYGIDEVAFARENGPARLYISCIVMGLTLLGAYFWMKKRSE